MPPPVFRAPMRSRDDSVAEHAGVERGLARGVVGTGGRLARPPADLAEAVARVQDAYGERFAARLRRFAEVPDGATVWTRDAEGGFHRGTVTGPWRYDDSPAAAAVDLVHVRATTWAAVAAGAVPDAVRASFARGGRNFQGIGALNR